MVRRPSQRATRAGAIAARYTVTMTYINSVVDALPWMDLDWADSEARSLTLLVELPEANR